MTEAKTLDRLGEMDVAFDRRARANGRTFEQEVEFMLEQKQPLTREEGVAVIRYLHSRCTGVQPSLTLEENQGRLDVTTWVIDASVAVKWLVTEELSEVARSLYGVSDRLVAPRLITTEVANALARKTAQGALIRHEAFYHFSTLSGLLPNLIDVDDMISPALENACSLRHPIYDLIYLECARRLEAQLITADRRFLAKLANTDLARHVTLLSDWQPE